VFFVTSILLIPTGPGEHKWDEYVCETCKTVYDAPAGSARPVVSAGKVDVEKFALATAPCGEAAMAERLHAESLLRRRALGRAGREALILEPFTRLEHMARFYNERGGHISLHAVLTVLTLATLLPELVLLWEQFSDPRNPRFTMSDPGWAWCVYLGIAGVLSMAGAISLTVRRRMITVSRAVLPRLARSLAPLSPTAEEIERAFDAVAAKKTMLASGTSAAQVFAAVRRVVPR
jgi:hypothetical protein